MRYYWYNRQELLQETKDKYHNCGIIIIIIIIKGLLNIIHKITMSEKKQIIIIRICLENKNKQKENISRTGIRK